MTVTNPIVAYRKPPLIQKRDGGTHFQTQRGDTINDTGLFNVYPGDFTYTVDPTLEIEIGFWDDNEDHKSRAMYFNMTGRDGWNVANPAEFSISERIRLAWKDDGNGRITFGGKTSNTSVVMWRTGADHDRVQQARLRISTDIQKSAEERQAEMQTNLKSLGAKVSLTIEDDDGSDDKPNRQKRR